MEKTQIVELIENALEARKNSYSNISGFSVGAALLADDGTIFRGCNIEISGMGASCCAERSAVFHAASKGYRHFTAIAVVGGKTSEPISALCPPCGICRQVLAEFCDHDEFQIIVAVSAEQYEIYTMAQLLPLAFKRKEC